MKYYIFNCHSNHRSIFTDDIPIISHDEGGPGGDAKPLMSISEEKEEEAGFAPRGSSLRGKDAVTKNLQKLGIGKKSKDKEGKLALRGFTSDKSKEAGGEKRQSLQLTSFKEKVSLKSPHSQNGDSIEKNDSHSPLALSRKKSSMENGPIQEVTNGSISEGVSLKSSSGFITETQSILTSDSIDSVPLDDDVMCLDSSPTSHKKLDDKPFMQVSSV